MRAWIKRVKIGVRSTWPATAIAIARRIITDVVREPANLPDAGWLLIQLDRPTSGKRVAGRRRRRRRRRRKTKSRNEWRPFVPNVAALVRNEQAGWTFQGTFLFFFFFFCARADFRNHSRVFVLRAAVQNEGTLEISRESGWYETIQLLLL